MQSFKTLYDGMEFPASSSRAGKKPKLVVTELRGDWKYQKEPCMQEFQKVYLFIPKYPKYGPTNLIINNDQGNQGFRDIRPELSLLYLIIGQDVLQLSRWYKCNYLCHLCWAHKDSYMCSPADLLQKPRVSLEDFYRVSVKPGQRCFLHAFSQSSARTYGFC